MRTVLHSISPSISNKFQKSASMNWFAASSFQVFIHKKFFHDLSSESNEVYHCILTFQSDYFLFYSPFLFFYFPAYGFSALMPSSFRKNSFKQNCLLERTVPVIDWYIYIYIYTCVYMLVSEYIYT